MKPPKAQEVYRMHQLHQCPPEIFFGITVVDYQVDGQDQYAFINDCGIDLTIDTV